MFVIRKQFTYTYIMINRDDIDETLFHNSKFYSNHYRKHNYSFIALRVRNKAEYKYGRIAVGLI